MTRVKVEGASEITGVPVGTLRFWRATNQGPRSYVVGRRLWYDVADLEAWLDEQKAKSLRGGVEYQQTSTAQGYATERDRVSAARGVPDAHNH